jgi:hypothetical protein
LSYHAFAAGIVHYGVFAAASAARIYGVPLEQALEYLRRFAVEGYVV